MAKKIPAKIIADFLKEQGIGNVFDVTGGMIAYIEDAISHTSGIECTPCHHEQACGFAAEGYARISRNFGVAMATSGPGATNLITAIGSCFFDSTSSMFITGQVHTESLRKDKRVRQFGFQETDIVSIIKTITKYAKQVKSPADVLYELEKGLFLSKVGRPGPVLLDIPINVQRTEVEEKACRKFFGSQEHKKMLLEHDYRLSNKTINRLKLLIQRASRPIVLVGGGVRLSDTTRELKAFVEANNLPVVSSLMGLDSFAGRHKNFVGFIGSYGNRDANIVFANSDLIIALGSRLDVRQTGESKSFAKNAAVIQVDIDRFSFGPNVYPDVPIHADLRSFFKAAKNMKTPKKENWFNFIKEVQKEFGLKPASKKNIDPNSVVSDISSQARRNAIVTSDVGNHQMWLAQSWRSLPGQRILFSGGMGSMGFGLPAAVGAYFAAPARQNIVICGDGGFQMNLQELETVKRNKIPVKIFLFNNKSLGMVREFQDLYLKKHYQSTVIGYSVPDFKKIALAYGLDYEFINDSKTQKGKVVKVLASRRSVLCEVDLHLLTKMEPKVVFGHALDDQSPFLEGLKKIRLKELKGLYLK
jgi:acetolactate synthase-1/2/3 large subunit